MTEDKVREIFHSKITEDKIILAIGQFISVSDFAALFISVPTGNYEGFMSVDNNEMGYKAFFDQCKAEGILLPLSE
jgi:hypothetical protein